MWTNILALSFWIGQIQFAWTSYGKVYVLQYTHTCMKSCIIVILVQLLGNFNVLTSLSAHVK